MTHNENHDTTSQQLRMDDPVPLETNRDASEKASVLEKIKAEARLPANSRIQCKVWMMSGLLLTIIIAIGGAICLGYQRESSLQTERSQRMAKSVSHDRDSLYLVIDLSGGPLATSYPVSTLSEVPAGGWTETYKTTKLVLRYIEEGDFMMGSPKNELGREDDENLHHVTLTDPYYIGVFEVTQGQWELVMGTDPSTYEGHTRPVESIAYADIRGWPAHAGVDATSFMGRLRTKTSRDFDLPTEAQWEYACRAGTKTALNSGKALTGKEMCINLSRVGRYSGNPPEGKGGYTSNHTAVGSYVPNDWGLYDMHGNVWEWCLDRHVASLGTAPVVDPVGDASGDYHVLRGGGWSSSAYYCRSAFRDWFYPSAGGSDLGFRLLALED